MSILDQIEQCVKIRCGSTERIRVRDTEFIVGRTSATNDADTYLVLDSFEGKDCIGHWIWECGLYVQFFKELQTIYPSLKILMNGYKRYKEQFCELLGVDKKYLEYESTNIGYSPFFKNTVLEAELYYPKNADFTVIVPRYTYLIFLSVWIDNEMHKLFTHMNSIFPFTPNVEKSVPFIYMRRSTDTTENYKNGINRRPFSNLDVVLLHMEAREIPVYDVKDFSNLKEQIEVVEKAKVIIVEHGSAFLMNGILFARNSHIIILNKLSIGCMDLEDRVCKENGNTYEFIESMDGPENIIINIQELSNAINLRIN